MMKHEGIEKGKKIENQSIPRIMFRQGAKNVCLQRSVTSVLSYWTDKYIVKTNTHVRHILERSGKDMNKISHNELYPIRIVNNILRKAGFSVERFPKGQKSKKKRKCNHPSLALKNDVNILLEEFNEDCFTICQLCAGNSDTTHTVSIADNWIFDSNFEHALPLQNDSLDKCVGSDVEYTGRPTAYKVSYIQFGLWNQLNSK